MTKPVLSFLEKGGVLSDGDIRLAIESHYIELKSRFKLAVQPSSLDIHLAPTIMGFARRRVHAGAIDLKKPVDDYCDYEIIDPVRGTILHPKEFLLGVTEEWIKLPDRIAVNVEGKSSLGRLGLVVHATAGFIDPGYQGHITLEITNLTELPMIIYPHMLIGQYRFNVLASPAEKLYGPKLGSKYFNEYSKNPKPMPSQYYKNFLKDK